MNSYEQVKKKRWFYVMVSVLLMLIYGTVYSWGIFRIPVENHYNIGTTLSGLPYMVFLFMYAVSMLIGGRFITRFPVKRTLMVGGVMISAGWLLSSLSNHILWLTLFYGVVIGFGVGISYGVPIYVIAKWFEDKKGVAVGIVLAGFGLSPILTAPIGQWLINRVGLKETFFYYGIVFGGLILILSALIALPKKTITKHTTQQEAHRQKMTRTKSFKYAYSCFLIGTLIGLTIIGLTNNVARDMVGIEAVSIVGMMVVFALFNGLGRPLFGWMTEKYGPKVSMKVSFLLIFVAAISMIFVGHGDSVLFMILFSVLWLNLGAWLSIAPMMTMKLYGMASYSSNYGIMFTAYGLGAVIGVVSTGLMVDVFDNYKLIFVFVGGLALIGYKLSHKVLEERSL